MKKKPKRPKSWLKAFVDSTSLPKEPTPTDSTEPMPVSRPEKGPVARRKRPPRSNTRKALEEAYKASYALIPDYVQCANCGVRSHKDRMTRHHPAGRRKAAFTFTFQVCEIPCHQWLHANPDAATLLGLLWTGRNSKVFTRQDAEKLVAMTPFNTSYALNLI